MYTAANTQGHGVPREGRGQGKPHEQRAYDEGRIAEHGGEGGHVALRNQDEGDVREDEHGVHGLEKGHILPGGEKNEGIPDGEGHHHEQQGQGNGFLGHDVAHALFGPVDEVLVRAQTVVEAEADENDQRPGSGRADAQKGHGVGQSHGFRQSGQLAERPPQQNEGHDFKLLPQRPGQGQGDAHDEADRPHEQHQRQRALNGLKMIGRQQRVERRGSSPSRLASMATRLAT